MWRGDGTICGASLNEQALYLPAHAVDHAGSGQQFLKITEEQRPTTASIRITRTLNFHFWDIPTISGIAHI